MKHSKWLFGLLFAAVIPAMASSPPAGPGLHETPMLFKQVDERGVMSTYNSNQELIVNMKTSDDWLISELHLFVHHDIDEVPTKKDNVNLSKFPFKYEYETPSATGGFVLDLHDDLDFVWGLPAVNERVKYVALHADLVRLGADGAVIETSDAWGFGDVAVPGSESGAMFQYNLTHPKTGHFRDSPVDGAVMDSPTFKGRTGDSGDFTYFPGESADFYIGDVLLGTAALDARVTPLDFFGGSDTTDSRVVNMARLLQSLDADGDPKAGITLTPAVEVCLKTAMENSHVETLDFADDILIDDVIADTILDCADVKDLSLVSVSAEDAVANLEGEGDPSMFRKNVSKTPELTSSKSKLNIMGVWFPTLKANNEATVVEYRDENDVFIRTAEQAKPIIVSYTDGVEETGYEDIFAGISRDDGNTFKRMNLSRAADRSSFLLANGAEYYGQAKKPVFQVKGNNILVAWSSKFCSGGKPAYAIDLEDDYTYDDQYYKEDIWGVGGPQRSVDYTDQGFPEVGEVPYSCVWTARGTIVTQGMINSGGFWGGKAVGDIVWYKPERLTSGRRDANQIFLGASDGAGFAIAWQEDPEGLRPGSASGPGPGWGGATTNHKTDIWYSYVTVPDFRKIDMNFESGGDPEHELDVAERPKALVPMSLPVRLSDNDTVNIDNLLVELGEDGTPVQDGDGNWTPVENPDADSDGDGTHAYGYEIEGLCESFQKITNYNGEDKEVCVTADNRLLDGDTGASRPNLFLQTYTKSDGTKSAWAIMAYEETKGAGMGPPDHETDEGPYGDEELPEVGKNAIYHSFDFQNPDLVSAGNIINLPERDADGNLMYLREVVGVDSDGNVAYGDLILDWQEQPQLAYENGRRPRFMLQGKSAMGASKTVLAVLYKEGPEGMGRASDIMMRRIVADVPGNPYAPSNMVCNAEELADNGLMVCVDGAQNMSSVTPDPDTLTDSQGEPTAEDPYGAVKVVQWDQTVENLADPSWLNPYDDARAHRGAIRGDFVVMGFSYTPNWAAARNGNDKYDFYVRRSFDGGQTWTTDPAGDGVTHCLTWTYPSGTEEAGTKVEECNTYETGAFEQMHNLSQLPNSKESVIEPRIVGAPGTIKVDGVLTGIEEDEQNKNVFYVSYGTSTNPPAIHGDSDEVQEFPAPLDLYYSFSQDRGENYVEVAWDVNPDSDGDFAGETVYRWDYLAKGEPEQGEAQLRMTPDGSRFYSSWLEEGEDGSDIMFRRIMSPAFPENVAQ